MVKGLELVGWWRAGLELSGFCLDCGHGWLVWVGWIKLKKMDKLYQKTLVRNKVFVGFALHHKIFYDFEKKILNKSLKNTTFSKTIKLKFSNPNHPTDRLSNRLDGLHRGAVEVGVVLACLYEQVTSYVPLHHLGGGGVWVCLFVLYS